MAKATWNVASRDFYMLPICCKRQSKGLYYCCLEKNTTWWQCGSELSQQWHKSTFNFLRPSTSSLLKNGCDSTVDWSSSVLHQILQTAHPPNNSAHCYTALARKQFLYLCPPMPRRMTKRTTTNCKNCLVTSSKSNETSFLSARGSTGKTSYQVKVLSSRLCRCMH